MQASAPCPAVLVLSSSVWCCWAWLPARPVSAVSLAPQGTALSWGPCGTETPPGVLALVLRSGGTGWHREAQQRAGAGAVPKLAAEPRER